jgi:general secretion pathway protein J
MAPSRRRGPAGFTLIEVLVALLIMSVMAVISWRGLNAMARARDVGQSASERTLLLSSVVAQWEQDLQAVQQTPVVPGLAFDGASLRLTRRADTGLQLVVWSVHGGTWLRWAGTPVTHVADLQEAWMRSQQLQGTEPGQIKLMESVQGWQLYFNRGGAWTNAQSTGDVAAPAAGASAPVQVKLPEGVRLVIDLPEGNLTRDVMLRSS